VFARASKGDGDYAAAIEGATVLLRRADEPSNVARCRLFVQTGGRTMGRACPLCPGISDVNLFRYRQGIVHFDDI
jgi:hypothetical protein